MNVDPIAFLQVEGSCRKFESSEPLFLCSRTLAENLEPRCYDLRSNDPFAPLETPDSSHDRVIALPSVLDDKEDSSGWKSDLEHRIGSESAQCRFRLHGCVLPHLRFEFQDEPLVGLITSADGDDVSARLTSAECNAMVAIDRNNALLDQHLAIVFAQQGEAVDI